VAELGMLCRRLERELTASNTIIRQQQLLDEANLRLQDRIKRLEEDLMDAKNQYAALVADVALYEDRGERIKQLEEALWLKQPISTAKEDKP
jgi:molecular chaperone GrpE (heat shock protein)